MVEVNRVKAKEQFVPISIVLETKEEADAMLDYLQCRDNISFDKYCEVNDKDFSKLSAIMRDILREFHATWPA